MSVNVAKAALSSTMGNWIRKKRRQVRAPTATTNIARTRVASSAARLRGPLAFVSQMHNAAKGAHRTSKAGAARVGTGSAFCGSCDNQTPTPQGWGQLMQTARGALTFPPIRSQIVLNHLQYSN